MNEIQLPQLGAMSGPPSRREAIKWVMGAVAASALAGEGCARSPVVHGGGNAPVTAGLIPANTAVTPSAVGYGTDPNLMKSYKPGDLWPLTFTDSQKATVAALADVIIPKDDFGPAATEVGVVEMVDEWISAPYPQQQADGGVVMMGIEWIETESQRRFSKDFPSLSAGQHKIICDDICYAGTAKPEFSKHAEFFARFRSICAGAYFSTPDGWKAVGYEGNTPLVQFDGPPEEVLKRLGVTQTVA